ncbi:MAG: DUF805 domain-containing protein [Sphingomonadales bacterium]|nr:DUF805 domain-containing protein [Sphingomonadales bacterium]
MGFELIGTLYSLAVLLPSLAVAVRRMHDVGKSGWFILIPIYNLILACTDSQVGENEYGSNPKDSVANPDILDAKKHTNKKRNPLHAGFFYSFKHSFIYICFLWKTTPLTTTSETNTAMRPSQIPQLCWF